MQIVEINTLSPSTGDTYAPMVTAYATGENSCKVRIVVITSAEIDILPSIGTFNRGVLPVNYTTNNGVTGTPQAWYLEGDVPVGSGDLTVQLVDGNPKKTSRGTVVIVQSPGEKE